MPLNKFSGAVANGGAIPLDTAASLLRDAKHVVVFTGAGMSADSGVATFRSGGSQSWTDTRAERLANIAGYQANADEAWSWYQARSHAARSLVPHPGYAAVRQIGDHVDRLTIITQNVDGLHSRAGSADVLELHGSLREVRCLACGDVQPWPTAPSDTAPRCSCGGLICPRVVLFGEDLPHDTWSRAEEAALACDLLVSVGTSDTVYAAAGIPRLVLRRQRPVVVINTHEPDTLPSAIFLRGTAAEMLPALVAAAWPKP